MSQRASMVLLPFLLGMSGCSGKASHAESLANGGSDGATGGTAAGGAAAPDAFGEFRVELVAANPDEGALAYTTFIGEVSAVPLLSIEQWQLDSEQGGCRLLIPSKPVCSPSCDNAGVCTDENVCTPISEPQNVGNVRVTGLGTREFVVKPMSRGALYQPTFDLPNPPCSEGSPVSVQADSFRIQGTCIASLTLFGADPLPVRAGEGVRLSWAPPGQSDITRIQIWLKVGIGHGDSSKIECDVPDTGAFEIPAPLVSKLVDLGLAGYPAIAVTRVSTAYSATTQSVRLVIASLVWRDVDSGVTSCFDDSACPAPQSCRKDETCGEL